MATQKPARTIRLVDPNGKTYTTTSPVEAVNLRARGYRTAPDAPAHTPTPAPAPRPTPVTRPTDNS